VKIKPGPMYLVRQPDGKHRAESEWNLVDWCIFRLMPNLIIGGSVAVCVLILLKAWRP
jgi:hypothetical protein